MTRRESIEDLPTPEFISLLNLTAGGCPPTCGGIDSDSSDCHDVTCTECWERWLDGGIGEDADGKH